MTLSIPLFLCGSAHNPTNRPAATALHALNVMFCRWPCLGVELAPGEHEGLNPGQGQPRIADSHQK